jgi:hypothetical protein
MWAIFLVIQSIVFMGPSIGSAVDFKVEDKNCWIEVFDDDEFDEAIRMSRSKDPQSTPP